MPVTSADLTNEFRFWARMQLPDDLKGQKEMLWQMYQEIVKAGSAEVTSTSFEGVSSTLQWRGATPEERQQALRNAIEEIEGQIAGDAGSRFRVPFGIRFGGGGPAQTLGNCG